MLVLLSWFQMLRARFAQLALVLFGRHGLLLIWRGGCWSHFRSDSLRKGQYMVLPSLLRTLRLVLDYLSVHIQGVERRLRLVLRGLVPLTLVQIRERLAA